jgi:hypothetical protein
MGNVGLIWPYAGIDRKTALAKISLLASYISLETSGVGIYPPRT